MNKQEIYDNLTDMEIKSRAIRQSLEGEKDDLATEFETVVDFFTKFKGRIAERMAQEISGGEARDEPEQEIGTPADQPSEQELDELARGKNLEKGQQPARPGMTFRK